jgi:hypothetical protein
MVKQRQNRGQVSILGRQVSVQSVAAYISCHAEKPRGLPPRYEGGPWLSVRGTLDEPVRDVREIVIGVRPEDRDGPSTSNRPSVGAIIQTQPKVHAVVGLRTADFDRVWTMATTGQLRYCWLAFTEPYRRSALVVSVQFSNERVE